MLYMCHFGARGAPGGLLFMDPGAIARGSLLGEMKNRKNACVVHCLAASPPTSCPPHLKGSVLQSPQTAATPRTRATSRNAKLCTISVSVTPLRRETLSRARETRKRGDGRHVGCEGVVPRAPGGAALCSARETAGALGALPASPARAARAIARRRIAAAVSAPARRSARIGASCRAVVGHSPCGLAGGIDVLRDGAALSAARGDACHWPNAHQPGARRAALSARGRELRGAACLPRSRRP